MNLLKENISRISEEIVGKNNFLLIDIIIRGNKTSPVIEIYIDGDSDISADDCVKISREIETELEQQSLVSGKYRLDVSSPGADRPLKFLRQYYKHKGRKFDLTFKKDDRVVETTAKLDNIEGDNLFFLLNNGQEELIKFKDIVKAKVIISFS